MFLFKIVRSRLTVSSKPFRPLVQLKKWGNFLNLFADILFLTAITAMTD